MKTVLLAGGLGTRMREETEFRPKPMVLVGDKPALWHIMKSYDSFGFKEFIICTGYKGDVIKQYFHDFSILNKDFTVQIGANPKIKTHGNMPEEGWSVTVADTGALTMTGGRLFKVRDFIDGDTFMCTYGDGISNVDIRELLKFHESHGKVATMTTVRPVSRFGVVQMSPEGLVEGFQEKPQSEVWINAGFFVFNRKIFDFLDENSVLEQDPMQELAKLNELMAFKHHGFWQPMDTLRESQILNQMWNEGRAPWKTWI